MNTFSLIFLASLSTACGREVQPADAQTAAPVKKPDVVETTPDKEPAKTDEEEKKPTVAQPEKAQKALELTSEQQRRVLARFIFDTNLSQGRLFHDVAFKQYYYRGDEGTMSYPDLTYVPVGTKNISVACPLGFKQIDRIYLSIAISHGLFDKFPPESPWIWTGDDQTKYGYGDAFDAYSTTTYTNTWSVHFDAGFFYPLHKARTVGRLYCSLSETDIPNVDDLPAGYMEDFESHFHN